MVQIYQGVGGRVMQSFDTALFNIVREARRFSHVHDQYAWFLEMANQKELLLEMMNAHVS
jgi:hypothetical protein